ncbi:hypothetical protein RRG08_001098 [Elysia crispata]|uniref:Uncharacterized protein n=1 Tax=Elysia crispata TaxID=231223 RepID=A0AAE1AY01_9GAST|nr:hypothetical protein RRG08_001098 [Elysia crispata]
MQRYLIIGPSVYSSFLTLSGRVLGCFSSVAAQLKKTETRPVALRVVNSCHMTVPKICGTKFRSKRVFGSDSTFGIFVGHASDTVLSPSDYNPVDDQIDQSWWSTLVTVKMQRSSTMCPINTAQWTEGVQTGHG